MTQRPQDAVAQFHRAFGLPVRTTPTLPARREAELRMSLLSEESAEAGEAMNSGNILNIAQELADVVYVAYGAALTYGIDLDRVIAEVHRANMSKVGEDGKPERRADGKVLKGPGYSPPNVGRVLHEQQMRNPL